MKVTIEKKETFEIEVTLPAFRKDKFNLYKIEEHQTIRLYSYANDFGIEVTNYCLSYPFKYDECTESEFNEKLNQIKSKI